ncbi:MAG: hypothetical protein ABIR32_18350 [Ilumatobacteraceae bacterium]
MTNVPPPPPFGPLGGADGPGSTTTGAANSSGPGGSLPPPTPWTGFQPGTPGGPSGPGGSPQPYISPPPPSSQGRSKLLVVGAVIAVLAIVSVGLFVVTRDDDDSTATDTTAQTVTTASAIPATTTTAVPDTTTTAVPETSTTVTETTVVESTTTVAESTTTVATIPAIPEGAADLGNGVALLIPAGFSQTTGGGGSTTLTDNVSVIYAQTAVRSPGTDPGVLTQEYVNAFDPFFTTISYSPTAKSRSLAGEPATDVYSTYFVTFDGTTKAVQTGSIDVYVRTDGLVLVVSAYGPNGYQNVIPTASSDVLNASFLATPLVGAPQPLVPLAPFRVATIHPPVTVDGLVAFTAAPGFSIVGPTGQGRGFVTNGTEDVQVDRTAGQADVSVVTSTAQGILSQNYTGIEYSELTLSDPDPWGVVHGSFNWVGFYVGGQRSVGNVDLYYDPATTNAYVMFRTWFAPDAANDADPSAAESQFMLRTLFNSFTIIP